jgi:hypothetical protein
MLDDNGKYKSLYSGSPLPIYGSTTTGLPNSQYVEIIAVDPLMCGGSKDSYQDANCIPWRAVFLGDSNGGGFTVHIN